MKLPSRIDQSLKSPHLGNVGIEIADAVLDISLDESLMKEIPGFSILFGLGKVYSSISDRIYTNKLLTFFSSIKDVDAQKRKDLIEEINNDPTTRIKVGEKLMHIIDKAEDSIVSCYIGFLFRDFIQGEFSYEDFVICASILNKLSGHTIEMIKRNNFQFSTSTDHAVLSSSGMVSMGQFAFMAIEQTKLLEFKPETNSLLGMNAWDDALTRHGKLIVRSILRKWE